MGPSGVADRIFVKLKYSTLITPADQTTGVVYEYVFRGNSLFDPDFTSAGAQPTYFDNYAALYNKYRVHKSKIRVESVTSPNNGASYITAIYPSDGSSGLSSILDYMSSRYGKWKKSTITSAGSVTIKNSMSTKKKFGLTKINQTEEVAALVNANPSEVWYWVIANDGSDNSATYRPSLAITVTYYAEFYDPTDVGLSSATQRKLDIIKTYADKKRAHDERMLQQRRGQFESPNAKKPQITIPPTPAPEQKKPQLEMKNGQWVIVQ